MRKLYPSQIRYLKENPTITFRMKKEEKDRIKQMANKSGKSVSELVRIALLDLEEDFSVAFTNAYNKGMDDWAIWCYCSKCRKYVDIKPNSDNHNKIIEAMDGHLEHLQCPL